MAPADQRLHAYDLVRLEAHFRLVVQHELLVIDRAPQIAFEFQAGDRLFAHPGVEDLETRSAERLGFVHGGVRIAQDLGRSVIAGAAGNDADTRGGEHFFAFQLESRVDGLAASLLSSLKAAWMDSRIRSAIRMAPSASTFSSRMANSSPPNRAITSCVAPRLTVLAGGALRTAERRRCATWINSSSPAM